MPGPYKVHEDQLVKTRGIGNIRGFYSVLPAVRVGFTPWRRAWVRWKADIQEINLKKNWTEKSFFFMEKICFENFVSEFFENIAKSIDFQ